MKAYGALAQEPWCYTPEQIGRLTDLQILKLYVEPAVERSKEMGAAPGPAGELPRRPTRARSTGPEGEPGSATHRAQCVRAYIDVQGLSPERAAAQYDRQLAQWRAEQGT